jgi:hypothetical protein
MEISKFPFMNIYYNQIISRGRLSNMSYLAQHPILLLLRQEQPQPAQLQLGHMADFLNTKPNFHSYQHSNYRHSIFTAVEKKKTYCE